MDGPTGSNANNGVWGNGYEPDNSAGANTDEAGGTFRGGSSEERVNHQHVADRSPNVYVPTDTYMTPPPVGSGTGESPALSRTDGSGGSINEALNTLTLTDNPHSGVSSDDDASDLSITDSSEGAVEASTSELEQLIEGLTIKLKDLELLSGQADSEEDKAKYKKAVKEFGPMISGAISFSSPYQLLELNEIACQVLSWCEENDELLGQLGVKPCDLQVPGVGSGVTVSMPLDTYINGVAHTGVMFDLEETLEKIDAFLEGHEVSVGGYCLYALEESCQLVLSLSFTRNNDIGLPHFIFPLDGNREKDRYHFANMLDAYLQPVFQDAREAGASAPEGSLEAYFQQVFDEPSPEDRHPDYGPTSV